jgi:hypothetical protein
MFHFWSIHEKILNPVTWLFSPRETFFLFIPISYVNRCDIIGYSHFGH